MSNWIRRVRGAIGMGLIWALAWFSAGMALLFVVGFGAADVPFPLGFGLLGFLAGVSFSMVLVLFEDRRTFNEMSLPRIAGWGAVGGLGFCAVFVWAAGLGGALPVLTPVFALAGAGSAAGTLVLARMADSRDSIRVGVNQVEHAGLRAPARPEDTGKPTGRTYTSSPPG